MIKKLFKRKKKCGLTKEHCKYCNSVELCKQKKIWKQ